MAEEINSPDQVSDFKLKISYWYVTHKFQLRKFLIIGLFLLNIIFYSYIIFRSSVMFFLEQPNYLRMLNSFSTNLVDYSYFRTANQPTPLKIVSFTPLANGAEGVDYVVNLQNSNENWIIKKVTVQLVNAGQVIDQKETFVYPNENKYVVFFNEKDAPQNSSSVSFVSVNWQRTENFADFATPRLNFAVSDIKFQAVSSGNRKDGAPVSTLDFKLANNTAYGYWQVGVYMILMNGGRIGAANYLALDQLKAGEIRDVSVNWTQSLPSVSTYLILPEVDILNSSSYMPVE